MIVFCEYVVLSEHRDCYLTWLKARLLVEGSAMQALENTEEPGVFVEIWPADGAAHAHTIEKERREGRSWQEMVGWIKGGEAGLRIWAFRPVSAN